ncbi:MAG: hypothetical protein EU532_04775 [Promethearchaeota archaeon]|nr:MAG: hypothetical protein EU532_04775 [Candidatus Lokiarchaeota archaeon]
MSETIKIDSNFYNLTIDNKYGLSSDEINKIIDQFARTYSVLRNNDSSIKLPQEKLNKLSGQLKISNETVQLIIENFLTKLVLFRNFVKYCEIRIGSMNKNKKLRIYLHKIYRLAPIFDYKRARINLNILYRLFEKQNFWPTLTTQLAILIYITDRYDPKFSKKILQKNIQIICNCSAYAFHRTKNRLEIDRMIKKIIS